MLPIQPRIAVSEPSLLRLGRKAQWLITVTLASCCWYPVAVAGETIQQAMQAAAERHPVLLAEQARNRAARAGIDIARSGYYPRVTATGDIGASSGDRGLSTGASNAAARSGNGFLSDPGGRFGYSLAAELPLFDGWRTQSAVSEARAGADGAANQLLAAETSILLEAVAAFAEMIRSRQTETLRSRNRIVLEQEVSAALERMIRGTSTETDVAQTRARHAQAIADLIVAKSDTKASAAEYERVTGRKPGTLDPPGLPAKLLPKTLKLALSAAETQNPSAAAAGFKAAASRHAIDRLQADRLPQVKLRGAIEGGLGAADRGGDSDGASVGVRVVVPLYDGGETAARIEQAKHLNASLEEDARGWRERVGAAVAAAWSRLEADRERLVAERQAVSASRQALDAMKEEIRLGQRSTLDGLDAQRELVANEVRVAASERDRIVSAYSLLALMGRLTVSALSGISAASGTNKNLAR